MKPIKAMKQRTIEEWMLVCPECYSKTVVGITEKKDVECTNPGCKYIFEEKYLE